MCNEHRETCPRVTVTVEGRYLVEKTEGHRESYLTVEKLLVFLRKLAKEGRGLLSYTTGNLFKTSPLISKINN